MEQIQTPVFTLSIGQLEPLIKTWFRDCIVESQNNQSDNKSPKFLTRDEVAKSLKISLVTLDRYSDRGLIKAKRIGNRILFLESDVSEACKALDGRKTRR